MSILSQLSSQCGDRTEQSNIKVTFLCLEEPELLQDIRTGLISDDDYLAGDCAEVMTKVAEDKPNLIVPFAHDLIAGLSRSKARVRWESMHALALIADRIPEKLVPLLKRIDNLMHQDKSVIVRHCSVLTLANMATSGIETAVKVVPYLKRAAFAWDGKFAAHAIDGLGHVAQFTSEFDVELSGIALRFFHHKRTTIRQAARKLIRLLETRNR